MSGFDPSTAFIHPDDTQQDALSGFDPSTAFIHPDDHPTAAAPAKASPTAGLSDNGNASFPARALAALGGLGVQPADVENGLAAIGGGATMAAKAGNAYTSALADRIERALGIGSDNGKTTAAANDAVKAQTAQDANLRDAQPLAYMAPAAAGVAAALPELGTGGILSTILGGGASGAIQAGLTGDSPLTGAIGGSVGGGVAKALGGAMARAVNAGAGRVDPQILAAQNVAQAVGGPVTLGDINPGGAWSALEGWSKPFYGSGRRQVMKAQADAMAANADAIQAGMPGASSITDPEAAVISDLRTQFNQRRGQAKSNYDTLAAVVKATGNDAVPATQTVGALGSLAKEYDGLLASSSMPNSTKAIIGKLLSPADPLNPTDRGLLALVNGQPTQTQLAAFESASPGITQRMSGGGATPTLTFDDARKLRSGLKALQRDKDLTPDQGAFVGNAANALEADQGAWADSIGAPQVKQLAQDAADHYRTQVAPYYNSPAIAPYMKPGAQGQGMIEQLGKTRFANAGDLVGALGPDGQNALATGLLSQRLAPAVTDNLDAGVSTSKLMRALDTGDAPGLDRAGAQIYDPATQAQLATLRQYAELAKRAPDWSSKDHTGVKALPFMSLMTALSGHPLGALPFVAAKAVNKASASPAFQRFAGAEGLDPNSILPLLGAQGGAGLLDMLGQ